MLETIFELLDAATPDGFVDITIPAYLVDACEPSIPKERAREVLIQELSALPWLTPRLEAVKSAFEKVCNQYVTLAGGGMLIRLYLPALLSLPEAQSGQSTALQLREIRGFYAAMKPFHEEYRGKRPVISLMNSRTRGKQVYCTLSCRFNGGKETSEGHTQRLRELAESSEVISAHLRGVALGLQKLGPHSWSRITPQAIFGDAHALC